MGLNLLLVESVVRGASEAMEPQRILDKTKYKSNEKTFRRNHQTTETALFSVMSHKNIRQVGTKMLK